MRFLIIFGLAIFLSVGLSPRESRADDELLGRVFSEIERQVIGDYYRNLGGVQGARHVEDDYLDTGGLDNIEGAQYQ